MFDNDKVTDEIEVYILGFFYADGYMSNRRNDKYYSVGTSVSLEDKQLILDISKHFDNPVIKLEQTLL